jgi:hypothetical protein
MLFDRQKRLLALLDAHNGKAGLLDFQRLLQPKNHGGRRSI